jgi:hypothetical protein
MWWLIVRGRFDRQRSNAVRFQQGNRRKSISTEHKRLSLPLFVARIIANDVNDAATANNFAVIAQALHAGADFHGNYGFRKLAGPNGKPISIGFGTRFVQGPNPRIFCGRIGGKLGNLARLAGLKSFNFCWRGL